MAIGVSFLGNLDQLLSYMTFAMWMQRTIVQIALIWMRFRGWTFPKDAFRTPIIVPLVFFCICIVLLVLPVRDVSFQVLYVRRGWNEEKKKLTVPAFDIGPPLSFRTTM